MAGGPARRVVAIRDARPADAARVAAVHDAAVRDLRGRHYTDEEVETWASVDATAYLDREAVVAEFDDDVVGFAALDPAVSEVEAVYVHPSHKRSGVGKLLLSDLERRASERGSSTLHLVAPLTATFFCLRCRYRPVERTATEAGGAWLDAMLMEKDLPDRE